MKWGRNRTRRIPPRQAVRPRTEDERKAYVSGWATCLETVDKHGLPKAAEELGTMAVLEGMATQEQVDGS